MCGRFLVNLREVLISERILWRCSLIKEEINFWEEDLTSENHEYVTVIEDIFGTETQEIVESVLDESNAKVTTGKTLLIAGDVDIADDA